jgi:hypothetical protein
MTTGAIAIAKRCRPLRERAWWVMREMTAFSLDALLLTVAEGTERSAADNLRRYIRALERHGVLAPVRQSRDATSYQLAHDLGPRAPVYRRSRRDLYDPNAGHAIHSESQS